MLSTVNLKILHNKSVQIALGVTILILILVLTLSPKKSTAPTSLPLPTPQPRTELINLSQEKRDRSIEYLSLISSRLPIYLDSFRTSVGLTTSIRVYRLADDEPEVVRLEIYGLSYMNKDELDEKKNPNVTAFRESYNQALSLMREVGIDPKQLIFIYGDKEYVRKTTQIWIDALNLQP